MHHSPHRHWQQPVAVGFPNEEANWPAQHHSDSRTHWALRAGRWQGAIAVVVALLFWRFFLFAGLVALGFFFLTGGKRESREGDAGHHRGRRWRRRRSRKHRPVARRALEYQEPVILDEQKARIHDHQAAIADFDRRLNNVSTVSVRG